jgi:cell division protein FtsA
MEAGTKVRELYVGIPGEYIHVYTCEAEVDVPDGKIDDNVVNAVQDAAADYLRLAEGNCMVLHRTPAWYLVDGDKKTMSPYGKGNRLRAMMTFIVAEPVFIEDVSEMLKVLNITILGFLSPSLGESLLLLSLDDRDRTGLLIDCGYLNTEISVIEGDAIVYHAILPRGGGHITADLAMGLRVPMRAAEQIKRGYVFNPDEFDMNSFSEVYDDNGRRRTFPREAVGRIVESSFKELTDMIGMTIANDADQFLGKRSQVYLTGGGIALMRGAREALAAAIGRPVKISAAKSSKLNSPVYASALGLADLIFDSIEGEAEPEENLSSRIRSMFSRG